MGNDPLSDLDISCKLTSLNEKYSGMIPEYFCKDLELFLESLHSVAQEQNHIGYN